MNQPQPNENLKTGEPRVIPVSLEPSPTEYRVLPQIHGFPANRRERRRKRRAGLKVLTCQTGATTSPPVHPDKPQEPALEAETANPSAVLPDETLTAFRKEPGYLPNETPYTWWVGSVSALSAVAPAKAERTGEGDSGADQSCGTDAEAGFRNPKAPTSKDTFTHSQAGSEAPASTGFHQDHEIYAARPCSLEGALDIFRRGLMAVDEDPELRYESGQTLFALGRFAEAKEQYLRIDPDISGHLSSIDIGILGPKRFAALGQTCLAMGEYPEARDWFRKAVEAGNAPCAIELYNAAIVREDFKTAREAADLLRKAAGPVEEWAEILALLAQSRGENVLQGLSDAVAMNPGSIGPLLILTRHLLVAGLESEATQHLETLDQMDCAEGAFNLGVVSVRRRNLAQALEHTKRACALDPANEAYVRQLKGLEEAIAENQAEKEGQENEG